MKLSYSIHGKNIQINKTDYFDDDDSLSVLFSKAKDCLNENEFQDDCIFSINGEILDENMLISQYIATKNQPNSIRLSIERKIPISLMLNNFTNFIYIEAYENIKISDSPHFKNALPGNIESFFFMKNGEIIDIYQTPKELEINSNTTISAFDKSSNGPQEIKSFLPSLNSQILESDSQSFGTKTDTQSQEKSQSSFNASPQDKENSQKSDNNNNNSFTNDKNSNPGSFSSSSNSSSLTSFSRLVKNNIPQVIPLKTPADNNLKLGDIFTSTKPNFDQPTKQSILVPRVYSAIITVQDASGDGIDIQIRRTEDATEMAENLLSITATDVIEAYCEICGIENEGLILFSPKWEKLDPDSLIWKLFLKKKRIKKSDKKDEKLEKKVAEADDKKLINYLNLHESLSADVFIRQNKELMNHFDVLVNQIPFSMQEDQLLEHFKRFGNVTNICIFRNKKEKSRGIGRITFEREIDANKAVQNMKTLRYTKENSQLFMNVFRPLLDYASTSKKKKKAIFYDRI